MPTKAHATLAALSLSLASIAHPPPAEPAPDQRVTAAVAAPAIQYQPSPSTTTTSPPATTTTTTTPQPPSTASSSPPEAPQRPSGAVPDIIRQVFAPYGPEAVSKALRVAECESGYNPGAQNASGASGVFQVMPVHAENYLAVTGLPYYDGRFDPVANSRFAAWLAYEAPGGGWSHWTC